MSRGGVNGIITGEKPAGERLVELFRLKLFAERPELLTEGSMELRDESVSPGQDIWKPRAMAAERKLADIRRELRRLLDETSDSLQPGGMSVGRIAEDRDKPRITWHLSPDVDDNISSKMPSDVGVRAERASAAGKKKP
jgi:hypothetical protein